jgi:hypothetical protein
MWLAAHGCFPTDCDTRPVPDSLRTQCPQGARPTSTHGTDLAQGCNPTPDTPVRTHDDERACTATDAVSFADPTATGTSNVRIVKKNPE